MQKLIIAAKPMDAPGLKVLVATTEGQGLRPTDFCWTYEGELVRFGAECWSGKDDDNDNDAEEDNEPMPLIEVDDPCGCHRSLIGNESQRATTTFKVAWLDMTRAEVYGRFLESDCKAGWLSPTDGPTVIGDFCEIYAEVLRFAASYPVGTLLERRGWVIQPRITTATSTTSNRPV